MGLWCDPEWLFLCALYYSLWIVLFKRHEHWGGNLYGSSCCSQRKSGSIQSVSASHSRITEYLNNFWQLKVEKNSFFPHMCTQRQTRNNSTACIQKHLEMRRAFFGHVCFIMVKKSLGESQLHLNCWASLRAGSRKLCGLIKLISILWWLRLSLLCRFLCHQQFRWPSLNSRMLVSLMNPSCLLTGFGNTLRWMKTRYSPLALKSPDRVH